MQKITPFLWFDDQAEEAMNFYTSIFKNSKKGRIARYGDAGPGPMGTVMSAIFDLDGQEFFALNGGPQFTFSPAISFFVTCRTQAEVDEYWEKLSAGGQKQRCGWRRDDRGHRAPGPRPLQSIGANPDEFMSANSGPGYSKHPEHRVHVAPAGVRVRVTFNGEVIADTRDAIKLEESGYSPVYYVPRRDVKMQ